MKRQKILLVVALVTGALFGLLYLSVQKPRSPVELRMPRQSPSTQSGQLEGEEIQKDPEQSQSVSISSLNQLPPPDSGIEASNALYETRRALWEKPIEFFGKVVDENGNPISEAEITFRWSGLSDDVFTSTTKSDAVGLFSLRGQQGRALDVLVSKEGYYAFRDGYGSFLYSLGRELHVPDPDSPVIFKLRRKGSGAELLTSQRGIQPKLDIRVPVDNTPAWVDLLEKRASAVGQLEISQIKPPWREATNWSFSLSIPSGGLIENQDEFQFQAPATNYQPTVEYHFAKGETNWTTQVNKQFYIQFGNPPKYGWLRIESNISQETVFLTYAINPTGSRNLEPAEPAPPRRELPPGVTEVIPTFER